MLDGSDRDAITEAVRQAELKTSAEIVVVVDRAASGYRTVPLITALFLALLIPWPFLFLTEVSAPRIFLVQLVGSLLLIGMLGWYGRGGRFVPGFVKRGRAHDAALREFVARGLTRTAGRTGVLLYIAIQERYAEIVADTGLDQKVGGERWDTIIAALTEAAKQKRLREGLIAAVSALGDILAEHAPRRPDDADELPNKVILL